MSYPAGADLDDDQQLARLRVAVATRHLPPDLGAWVLDTLDALSPILKQRARNRLLRTAAELVGGSPWRRATALEAALRGRPAPGLTPAAQTHVLMARNVDPTCPRSRRQLLRVVQGRAA